jgi:hypothetical protein
MKMNKQLGLLLSLLVAPMALSGDIANIATKIGMAIKQDQTASYNNETGTLTCPAYNNSSFAMPIWPSHWQLGNGDINPVFISFDVTSLDGTEVNGIRFGLSNDTNPPVGKNFGKSGYKFAIGSASRDITAQGELHKGNDNWQEVKGPKGGKPKDFKNKAYPAAPKLSFIFAITGARPNNNINYLWLGVYAIQPNDPVFPMAAADLNKSYLCLKSKITPVSGSWKMWRQFSFASERKALAFSNVTVSNSLEEAALAILNSRTKSTAVTQQTPLVKQPQIPGLQAPALIEMPTQPAPVPVTQQAPLVKQPQIPGLQAPALVEMPTQPAPVPVPVVDIKPAIVQTVAPAIIQPAPAIAPIVKIVVPVGFDDEEGLTESVAVGGNLIFCLSPDGKQLLNYNNETMNPNPWEPIALMGLPNNTTLEAVACGGYSAVFLLDANGVAYRATGVDPRTMICKPLATSPASVARVITSIAAGDDETIWAVDSNRNVLQHNGTDWVVRSSGVGIDVAVGGDNYVVAINTEGNPFFFQNNGWKDLPKLPGSLNIDQIAVVKAGELYAIAEDSSLWHFVNNGWTPLKSATGENAIGYKNVATNSMGTVFVTSTNNEIYNTEVNFVPPIVSFGPITQEQSSQMLPANAPAAVQINNVSNQNNPAIAVVAQTNATNNTNATQGKTAGKKKQTRTQAKRAGKIKIKARKQAATNAAIKVAAPAASSPQVVSKVKMAKKAHKKLAQVNKQKAKKGAGKKPGIAKKPGAVKKATLSKKSANGKKAVSGKKKVVKRKKAKARKAASASKPLAAAAPAAPVTSNTMAPVVNALAPETSATNQTVAEAAEDQVIEESEEEEEEEEGAEEAQPAA